MATSIHPTVFPPGDSKYYRNNALQKIGIEAQLVGKLYGAGICTRRGALCMSSWGLSEKMPRGYERRGVNAHLSESVLRGQIPSTHCSGWLDLIPCQSWPLAVTWYLCLRGLHLSYDIYFSFKLIYPLLFCPWLCVKLGMGRELLKYEEENYSAYSREFGEFI